MERSETYGLTHIAVGVKDLERTKRFYQEVFGMKVMYDDPAFIQLATPGCNDILVFEKTSKSTGNSGDILHFGFRLRKPDDLTAVQKKITHAGGTIIDQGEFVPGSPYIFFKDPDGYVIEVWYEYIG